MRRASYSYLWASVPMLRWGWEPPMSCEQFMEDCQCTMAIADYHYVAGASLRSTTPIEQEGQHTIKSKGSVATQWEEFKAGLQGELGRLRAQALGIEAPSSWGYPNTIYSYEGIREALNAPNPLVAEEILDRLRWQWLEDMIEQCTADVERLYIYHLQLQLLQRQHNLREAAAQKYYQASYQLVAQQLSQVGLT